MEIFLNHVKETVEKYGFRAEIVEDRGYYKR